MLYKTVFEEEKSYGIILIWTIRESYWTASSHWPIYLSIWKATVRLSTWKVSFLFLMSCARRMPTDTQWHSQLLCREDHRESLQELRFSLKGFAWWAFWPRDASDDASELFSGTVMLFSHQTDNSSLRKTQCHCTLFLEQRPGCIEIKVMKARVWK